LFVSERKIDERKIRTESKGMNIFSWSKTLAS